MLQTLAERVANSAYGRNIRGDFNDQFKCVTENWMREKYDDTVKKRLPLENGFLIVELEDNSVNEDQDIGKSMNRMPCLFSSFILRPSKRIMNEVIRETDGFYSNNFYYGDTKTPYIHKKHWSTLIDERCVGKSVELGKIINDNAGMFNAGFVASKIKYCLVINEDGMILAKKSFKGYNEEHRIIKLNDFISLSEEQTISGRLLIDWTKHSRE